MLARTDIEFDCAWAATFGSSPDGLPALGPARNMDKVYLAYGFGGNGVTFASLGAQIIEGIQTALHRRLLLLASIHIA